MRFFSSVFRRRLKAGALAAGTLWVVSVTAGSETARSAANALWESVPLELLKWDLGDVWTEDNLSLATALAIRSSPALLSARPAIAAAWQEAGLPEEETESETEVIEVPVEETPLDVELSADNGVTAKTLVPTDSGGYTVCGRAYISNATDYSLTIQDLQTEFSAELTAEEPQILILHTHGSEAYTPGGGEEPVWSGDYRTTDSRYNVVKVGDEMAEVFGEAGISVLHDRTLYDYPSYSGAYDRSLAAIQSYLVQYPSIRFILDLHRDAVADAQGTQYKVVSEIEGEGVAAQLTLVVGSDGSGLTHPAWMENLRLATALQNEVLAEYPTLMRPILLRNSRYNQHATTGSLLVEVGAAGNSPEEAALAGRLLAQQMVDLLQAKSK